MGKSLATALHQASSSRNCIIRLLTCCAGVLAESLPVERNVERKPSNRPDGKSSNADLSERSSKQPQADA
eukprot:9356277-Lingulodinium_polyedra.AAC.1